MLPGYWLLGYWLASGSTNDAFPFSLILKTNKKSNAEKIQFALNKLGLKYTTEQKSHSLYISYKFEVLDQGKRFQEWSKILGFHSVKTDPKQGIVVPTNALYLSQEELLGVWEGWTTAEIYKNNNTRYAETLRKDIADFMQLVALKLGYRCSMKVVHPSGKQTSFLAITKR